MSMAEKSFNVIIRSVFVFAFGAFLWASVHHIATFFHNFEPDSVDWTGSYWLAYSVDGTALMLTIGMMFFSNNKPLHIKAFVWLFIIALTVFSWAVNWEYAKRFQSTDLTHDTFLLWLNPILASSFAFLNLAYSIVAELFGAEVKTVAQLQAEINAIDARSNLEKELKKRQGPSFIQQAKEKVIEAKKAVQDVLKDETETNENNGKNTPISLARTGTISTPEKQAENEVKNQQETPTKVEPLTVPLPRDDKLDITVDFLLEYPDATDEELASFLDLQRPASARFWRLKAREIVAETRRIADQQNEQGANTPSQKQVESDPEIHAIPEPKITQEYTLETPLRNAPSSQQKKAHTRYTISEAAKLEVCIKKGLTSADIRGAIKAGKLETKSDGKLSKTAVEIWAKTVQKVTA